jgi:hypothetical protein
MVFREKALDKKPKGNIIRFNAKEVISEKMHEDKVLLTHEEVMSFLSLF